MSEILPYGMVIADGVILCKDGGFMQTFLLDPPDMHTLSEVRCDFLHVKLAEAMSQLDSGWSFHFDCLRRQDQPTDQGVFPEAVTQRIDDERVEAFNQASFVNTTALTVRWSPSSEIERKLLDLFNRRKDRATEIPTRLAQFQTHMAIFMDSVSAHMPIEPLMDYHQDGVVYSPQLTFLASCLWDDPTPMSLHPYGAYIDCHLATEDVWFGTRPYIQGRSVACLCVDGFPPSTHPALLSGMAELPFEFRWSTRFIQLTPEKTQSVMKYARRMWEQGSRSFIDQYLGQNPMDARQKEGMGMVEDIDEALMEQSDSALRYGYYSSTFVLRNENVGVLEAHVSELRKMLSRLGCRGRIETINSTEAFLSTLPGDLKHNLRRPMLHNLHFLNLIPLSSVWLGDQTNPSPLIERGNAPAHMVVRTAGQGSFYLNLHVEDVGHSLVFGLTGSGKSVLLASLAAQFMRYDKARVVCLDKGSSMRVLTYGVGGQWTPLSLDADEGFAPIASLTSHNEAISEVDQLWLQDWIESIYQLNQGVALTSDQRKEVTRAIRAIAQPGARRSLLDFQVDVQDAALQSVLAGYCGDGIRAPLFDKSLDADANPLHDTWTCFEMEELLSLDDKTLVPLLLYIFHMIEKGADGSPTLLIMDEAWALMRHEMFHKKIEDWLKTMRKKSVAVVMATQSIADAVNSGMMSTLLESCTTRFYGANPEAISEEIRDTYLAFGLNENDLDVISRLTPKREYYLAAQNRRKVFNLELSKRALKWVASSDPESIRECLALRRGYPDEWQNIWDESP